MQAFLLVSFFLLELLPLFLIFPALSNSSFGNNSDNINKNYARERYPLLWSGSSLLGAYVCSRYSYHSNLGKPRLVLCRVFHVSFSLLHM